MEFSSFWDIIAIPFGYLMQFFSWICQGQYMLSLLLFALAVKLVTLPFSIKQQKSQIKMAQLRPKMALIEKKYAGRTDRVTLEKKQQELMELQQREGYSPLSGCLPMLIQFPVIIALYRIIRMPLKYLCKLKDSAIVDIYNKLNPETTVTSFEKIPDEFAMINQIKANPSVLEGSGIGLENLPNMEFLGINLGEIPSFSPSAPIQWWLILIPVLCCALSYLSMWISRKVNDDGTQAQQKKNADPQTRTSMTLMNITMPLMSLWICFITSGAVGVYWIYTSVLGILQTILLAKLMPLPKYTPEEIAEIQRAMKNQKNNPSPTRAGITSRVDENGRPKSLHYDGDDTDTY